jgi:hypothetical protein
LQGSFYWVDHEGDFLVRAGPAIKGGDRCLQALLAVISVISAGPQVAALARRLVALKSGPAIAKRRDWACENAVKSFEDIRT